MPNWNLMLVWSKSFFFERIILETQDRLQNAPFDVRRTFCWREVIGDIMRSYERQGFHRYKT